MMESLKSDYFGEEPIKLNELDYAKNRIEELENEVSSLKQEILDVVEDRKIHEKKGVAMVKELKKQLHFEKKRAEKLQEKLQEVLSDSSALSVDTSSCRKANAAGDEFESCDIFCNNSNSFTPQKGNDSSSVGSWSFMSSHKERYNSAARASSQYSGSEGNGKENSPSHSLLSEHQRLLANFETLEKENGELVSRITKLQQDKWVAEEKINHLELSTAAMADDILRKTQLIQHYCMEGRPDPHHPQQDKLTVKRVVDFIKDKGDENLRDINRKTQRMLEETLTKNMHLQLNLETLSGEVVTLKKVINDCERCSQATLANDSLARR